MVKPWPPNPKAPPAVVSMSDNSKATIAKNLARARQLLDEGKDPVNACQASMVLLALNPDAAQAAEVKQTCIRDATLFWATGLTAQIEKQKKAKKPVTDDCAAARGHLALAGRNEKRAALEKRLDSACGRPPPAATKPVPKCRIEIPEADISDDRGGLPCPEAEEIAKSFRDKGFDAKVIPLSP